MDVSVQMYVKHDWFHHYDCTLVKPQECACQHKHLFDSTACGGKMLGHHWNVLVLILLCPLYKNLRCELTTSCQFMAAETLAMCTIFMHVKQMQENVMQLLKT